MTKLKKVSDQELVSKVEKGNQVVQENKEEKIEVSPKLLKALENENEFDNVDTNSHPVFKKLKQKLGIKPLVIHNKTIVIDGEPFVFGITEYAEEANLSALEEFRIITFKEGETKAIRALDILRVGLSLVHLNEEPIYEVFDVELDKAEKLELALNPLNLPSSVRIKVAKKFRHYVLKEFKEFFSYLEEFYIEKIMTATSISAYDSMPDNHSLYKCDVPGCDFSYKGQILKDVNGVELPYMCTIHATPMKRMLSPFQMNDLPLE